MFSCKQVLFCRPFRISLFVIGIFLAVFACGLLVLHAHSFSLKRDTAVMIGISLPELRSSVALLTANRQAEAFFSQHAESLREEQASVYVLPDVPSASRAVNVFQTIALAVTQNGKEQGSLSTVTFEKNAIDHGSFKTLSAHLKLTGTFRFVARFLSVLLFSGKMMIRDRLSPEASTMFLQQVNASAPLSLKTAEDFLYTDLLEYAANPDQIEQAMLKDLPLEVQGDLRAFLLSSGLASVRASLTSITPSLRDTHIWPLPFLTVDTLSRDGSQWMIDLTLYRR